jgi:hypothetical protein
MKLKAFGKAHDASTFLRMKTARMTVNEIHSGFGSNATSKGRQRDGMTLDAIDSLTLTSLSDSADPQGSQVASCRKVRGNKRVGSTNEKFLQTGIARREEDVLDGDVLFRRFGKRKLGKSKIFSKTDEVQPLSLLRYAIARSIEEGVMAVVADSI